MKHSHCLSLSRTQRIDALITGLSYSRLFPDLPAFAAEEGFLLHLAGPEGCVIAVIRRTTLPRSEPKRQAGPSSTNTLRTTLPPIAPPSDHMSIHYNYGTRGHCSDVGGNIYSKATGKWYR